MDKIVYINDFGNIVENGKYKMILTGSVKWSFLSKCYQYEVNTDKSDMKLKYLHSEEKLFKK